MREDWPMKWTEKQKEEKPKPKKPLPPREHHPNRRKGFVEFLRKRTQEREW